MVVVAGDIYPQVTLSQERVHGCLKAPSQGPGNPPGGECRAYWGALSPDTGNVFLLSFSTSLFFIFHNRVFSFSYI